MEETLNSDEHRFPNIRLSGAETPVSSQNLADSSNSRPKARKYRKMYKKPTTSKYKQTKEQSQNQTQRGKIVRRPLIKTNYFMALPTLKERSDSTYAINKCVLWAPSGDSNANEMMCQNDGTYDHSSAQAHSSQSDGMSPVNDSLMGGDIRAVIEHPNDNNNDFQIYQIYDLSSGEVHNSLPVGMSAVDNSAMGDYIGGSTEKNYQTYDLSSAQNHITLSDDINAVDNSVMGNHIELHNYRNIDFQNNESPSTANIGVLWNATPVPTGYLNAIKQDCQNFDSGYIPNALASNFLPVGHRSTEPSSSYETIYSYFQNYCDDTSCNSEFADPISSSHQTPVGSPSPEMSLNEDNSLIHNSSQCNMIEEKQHQSGYYSNFTSFMKPLAAINPVVLLDVYYKRVQKVTIKLPLSLYQESHLSRIYLQPYEDDEIKLPDLGNCFRKRNFQS